LQITAEILNLLAKVDLFAKQVILSTSSQIDQELSH